MTDPPPILGPAEIVLSVRDLPAMREFYRDVLGFPVFGEASHTTGAAPDPDGAPTICFLTITSSDTPLGRSGRHPCLLVLIDYERHVFAKSRFAGHDVTRSTLNHLAFEIPIDAFETHAARLRGLGLDVAFSVFPAMSARAMFFSDPEGNRLELIAHDPDLPPAS